MKKLFVIILAMLFTGYISCEKPKPEETKDYREKWEGSYECKKWNMQVIVDVTAKGDSILNITERGLQTDDGYYSHGVRHDVKVNRDGSFDRFYDGYSGVTPYIHGYFYRDSISISYLASSPSHTISFTYEGKKMKN